MAAVHSVTGLTEDEILWDLPLSRGQAYLHAALTREGTAMRWPGEDEAELDQLKAFIRAKPWRH